MAGTSGVVARAERRTPLAVSVSAWLAPLLVLTGFAFVAFAPVLVALVGALVRGRDAVVKAAAAVLAVGYAIPFAIWQLRPDGAQSLTKDIHPGFVVLIVAASAALLIAVRRAHRR
ncbi:hypothetical protein DSC45_02405 [Streptomyces sp. YIM 130001]|uniref:hypothetical protein n=1 Tax=Streptomyces sp. YIM 130001 TaxID=2259644 RepID=UPI000E64A23C|nr:hypothetical protein [Streptomyces sp. YIM 130001]RII20956.1 hypothetical protein DSC45_02405 [Streptomyces sp. YIM 130001]